MFNNDTLSQILQVLGAIVAVGLVTVIVTSPNSTEVIRSLGNAFTRPLRVAMGG